ncbi:hypothetical protein MTO96_021098 [Rhipicephalus appendiculatus]
MLKQWSRKFWLVALCAILCATMTAAEDEDNQNERTSEEAEASTHGYTDWDCIHHKGESKNGTHVYKKCALVCDGDQVSVVRNGELCWLNSTIATEELAAPKPIERSGEESAQGICKDQNCVPKEDDTQEVPAPK